MRFFWYPLPRNRLLALTIALLAGLWLALPVLKALAVPPDTGPIQGSATAVQDPPGSCPAQADIIPFNAVVSIKDGVLHITDPGGGASGLLNSNGTAQLTGPQETYNLLSIQGTTLNFREVYAGCTFRTTVVLQRVLFQVVTTPQANETASQPTVSGPPGIVTVPTSGGQSLWWLWGAGIAGGVVVLGGGAWFYLRQPVTITDVATRCPDERRRVEQARQRLQAIRDLPELQRAVGSSRSDPEMSATMDLAEALTDLAQCLGEELDMVEEAGSDIAFRNQNLLKRFGFPGHIPGLGDPPEPEGFDPVPPTEGSGEEGEERQEIG